MKLSELTTLYSPLDIAYSQAMSGKYDDISYHGEDCKVIAGLKDGKISGFFRPIVAVGDERSLKLQIVRLYETSRHISYMDFLERGKLSVISQFLLRQGYVAKPYFTQIIDVSDMEVVRRNLRKSYKSLVNKTQGVNTTVFERYQRIHREVCGGVRPDRTWQIQEEMVRTGKAFVVAGPGAAVLIYHNNHIAYYAGGRSLPGVNSHAVLWYAIETASQLRCKFFEIGEQVFSGDPKLVNVSKFKAGFCGTTQVRLILEPK
ncbi:hypothetical protein LCGC14_1631520 [marine sediment metagenome]|uniref:BioF2-like acetyltransferase domain-containing protein n=1 Tax=marine sediment metagenome TaxID=412755 RepID=A0A0F9L279_9ZZZZ